MASYRDKKNQEKMSTESGKIAWCIEWLQNLKYDEFDEYFRDYKELALYDDVSIWPARDAAVWTVCKPVKYKGNRFWFKYVPQWLTWKQTKNVLDAQPWQYW